MEEFSGVDEVTEFQASPEFTKQFVESFHPRLMKDPTKVLEPLSTQKKLSSKDSRFIDQCSCILGMKYELK